jgi:hypothetical protein
MATSKSEPQPDEQPQANVPQPHPGPPEAFPPEDIDDLQALNERVNEAAAALTSAEAKGLTTSGESSAS